MEDASARSCATAFLSSWVSRFGTPDIVTSDRGSVFLSEFWKSLGDLMGTRLYHTTAYNPSGNGLVEIVHRTLKQALMVLRVVIKPTLGSPRPQKRASMFHQHKWSTVRR